MAQAAKSVKTAGFVCSSCDYRTGNWLGKCPECQAWGTLEEQRSPTGAAVPGGPSMLSTRSGQAVPYPDIHGGPAPITATGIHELDRVLGGGLVDGATILLGGEPGIGKSTLLLQAAFALAADGHRVLYVSGEESAAQLKLRGDRVGVSFPDLLVLADTDVDTIVANLAEHTPRLLVVDSIQAVRCADVGSVPGSVTQVREAASRLVDAAKGRGVPLILVGHVTKDGSLAGPRVLEHLVDTVVQFEGDRHHAHRVLRALKNRFGPADELGVFHMTEEGLREVPSPSELFLAERTRGVPGSVVLAAVEGTRPLLVEIQALVGEVAQGNPRRTVLGVDPQRVALVLAVLQRRADFDVGNRDVFVNVTGGISVYEPASDLAVAAALVSSVRQRPVPEDWILAGEIGLTGEVRSIARPEARLREAGRLGFTGAIIPATNTPSGSPDIRVLPIRQLTDAMAWMFPAQSTP